MKEAPNLIKRELAIAVLDSLSLAFVSAMMAGGQYAVAGMGFLPCFFIVMSFFHVYRASLRYEMFKEQK